MKSVNFLHCVKLHHVLTIAGIFAVLTIASLIQNKPKIDEFQSHLPAVERTYSIGVMNYVFGKDYAAANTPLPYVIGAYAFKSLGVKPSLTAARIVNLIFGFISFILFYLIAARVNNKYAFLFSLIF